MPARPPPLSTRLGDVRSSPVRDILALTQFTTHTATEIAEGLARLRTAAAAAP